MKPESVSTSQEFTTRQLAPGKASLLARVGRWLIRWRWPLVLVLLACVFYETAWLTFLTPGEADLAHYECYALTFWQGNQGASLLPQTYCSFLHITTPQPAFHMLPREYPPLTILLFSLPLLAPLPFYALAFALLMTLCAGLIYWLLARWETRQAALIFVLYLLLGAAAVFQERFDLVPATCTLLCLLAAERGHWRVAYVALAFGVLFKLYPLVMLPALLLAEQQALPASSSHSAEAREEDALPEPEKASLGKHDEQASRPGQALSWPGRIGHTLAQWSWTNCLLCMGLMIAGMGIFALLNFSDAILSPLSYFLTRPPQIESLVGSLLWLGGQAGIPYTIHFDYGSLNISSALAGLLSPVDTLLLLAGLVALVWLQWRRHLDLAHVLVGLVCVLIVAGKVFSPQYLLWLFPLLACIATRGKTSRPWLGAWILISLLTTFIYAFYYSQMPDPLTAARVVQTLPGFFELVALRNLLLLITTLAFLLHWRGTRGQ